jgi:hypothetical protein
VQGPGVVRSLLVDGNEDRAKKLLGTIESRIGGITKARNYGYEIEGHHPISLGSALLAAEGLSVPDAGRFYQQARDLGLPIGTVADHMLPVTRLAHDYAHLDPLTHKTNKKGFQQGAMRFRQEDPIARANAWAPMANLEHSISNLGFNRAEEVALRRYAGDVVGISPELLYSTKMNPDYKTPTGRTGEQTYAQTAYRLLDKNVMEQLNQKAWGDQTLSGIIAPTQYKHEFKRGNKKPEYRDRRSTNAVFNLSELRPGQMDLMRRFT